MPFDSFLNGKCQQLSSGVVAQQESAMREALTRYFGHENWMQADFANRAAMKRYPDGREVFTCDNQELIEFYPLQIEHGEKDGKFIMTATRPYRMLTGPQP